MKRQFQFPIPKLATFMERISLSATVACGGRAVPSARAIASEPTLVMTCLPSLEVLRHVALGKDGLCEGDAIQIYIDFSTTGAHFSEELSAALKQRGIIMLDAPITGKVVTAENGGLGIMCSGPLPAFEQAEPIMGDLASVEVLYLGDRNGRAQTLKRLNNLLSATGMLASCEAFTRGHIRCRPLRVREQLPAGQAKLQLRRHVECLQADHARLFRRRQAGAPSRHRLPVLRAGPPIPVCFPQPIDPPTHH